MKNLFSILIFLAGITLFTGCRKSDDPQLPDGMLQSAIPLIVLTENSDALIQVVDDFRLEFTVDRYFKDGVQPQKMDVYMAMNEDFGNAKLVKADITTYPATIALTGPEIAQLFGISTAAIIPGTNFEIRADITLPDGTVAKGFRPNVYEIDPVSGDTLKRTVFSPYGSDLQNFPDASPLLKFRAVCDLDITAFLGNFTMEDPYFMEGNYQINVTQEGEDVLVISNYANIPTAVVKMKVNFKFQTISIAKQVFATTIFGYTNPAVQGSGVIDACSNKIDFSLSHSVDQGSFGTGPATMLRN